MTQAISMDYDNTFNLANKLAISGSVYCLFRVTPKPGEDGEVDKVPVGKNGAGIPNYGFDPDNLLLELGELDEQIIEQHKASCFGIHLNSISQTDSGLYVCCIDLDTKRSTMPDGAPNALAKAVQKWAKSSGHLYSRSFSERGCHLFVAITKEDALQLARKINLGDGCELELFSCGNPKNILLGGANVSGSFQDIQFDIIGELKALGIDPIRKVEPIKESAPRLADFEISKTVRDAKEAIGFIDPDIDYEDWIRIGQALHGDLGIHGYDIWDSWSAKGSKYPGAAEIAYKWNTFHDGGNPSGRVGIATLFMLAKEAGYKKGKTEIITVKEDVDPDTGEIIVLEQNNDDEFETVEDRFNQIVDSFPKPYGWFMDEVVRLTLNSSVKPQPVLALLSTLSGMAAGCGGKIHLPTGSRLNLYVVGIGETGSGKDAPRQAARIVANACGSNVIGKIASGQGLEDTIDHDYYRLLVENDEIGHILLEATSTKAAPYVRETGRLLLELWSASANHLNHRVKAASKDRDDMSKEPTKNPCVSTWGVGTPKKIGEALNSGSIEDGSINRAIYGFAKTGVKPRRNVTPIKMTKELLDHCAAIEKLNEDGCEIGIDPDANQWLDELIESYDDEANSPGVVDIKRHLLIRSFEKMERICGVLAVFTDPAKPIITLDHVAWAKDLIDASNRTIQEFASDYMHGGESLANAAKVLDIIHKYHSGRMRFKTALGYKLCKEQRLVMKSQVFNASRMSHYEFKDAMENLLSGWKIELVTINVEGFHGKKQEVACIKPL